MSKDGFSHNKSYNIMQFPIFEIIYESEIEKRKKEKNLTQAYMIPIEEYKKTIENCILRLEFIKNNFIKITKNKEETNVSKKWVFDIELNI